MIYKILTEYGYEIGLGHLVRCNAIANAFAEKHIDIELVIQKNADVDKINIEHTHFYLNWRSETNYFKRISKDTCLIIDSIKINQCFVDLMLNYPFKKVFIDDWNHLKYNSGIIIDWTIYAYSSNYYIEMLKNKKIGLLLGEKYAALRMPFSNIFSQKIKKNIRNILITFGGSDIRDLTYRVLDSLIRTYPKIRKHVVIGKAYKNIERLKRYKNDNVKIYFGPDEFHMKNIMEDVDIAISAAGQTLYELACVGVPTIAVSVVDNQLDEINGWKKADFIKYAGHWTEKNIIVNILNSIEKMKLYEVRVKHSENGKKRVDGNGARRIRDFIIKQ